MKKEHYYLTVLVAAIAAGTLGCSRPRQKNSGTAESGIRRELTFRRENITPAGTYVGTFPCADCGGKDIRLTINEDGTYSLKYRYQDKEGRLVEENGTYSISDRRFVVTVTPSSGDRTYYIYKDGNLVLTDSSGTVNDGELAEFYVLKRDTTASR